MTYDAPVMRLIKIPTQDLELTSGRPRELHRGLASSHDKAERVQLVNSFNV